MIKKIGVITLFLLGVLISDINAEIYLDLEADEILFEQDSIGVSANHNVKILYQDYIITANAFKYSKVQKIIRFPDRFEINKDEANQHIRGSFFHYDMNTYRGEARDFVAKFGRVKVTGKQMEFYSDKIVIKGASFTTCDHEGEASNYNVQAQRMIVYPQWGFFVAINAKVNTGLLPFSLPIPTYVYGAKRYGLSSTSSLIPDVGTNRTEGFFIKERIAYFVNRDSQGAVLFGSTERFGGYIGFEHGVSVGKNKEVYVTGIAAKRDKFTGRAQFNWDLWVEAAVTKDVLEELLQNFTEGQALPLSRLSVIMAHREVVNYERVSTLPLVRLSANNTPLAWYNLKLDADASFGKVLEELDDNKHFQAWRSNVNSVVYHGKTLSPAWDLRSELNYSGFWYDMGDTWQRLYATFIFRNKTSFLDPKFSFTKRLLPVFGASPFSHESNFAIVSDEVGMHLTYRFNRFSIGNKIDYNIQDYELRNFDVILGFALKCWTVFVNWKTEQNSISFGFDLK
jgi:hypothetical protein